MQDGMNRVRQDVVIDVRKLLQTYLRKWWLIVACALIMGGGSLYYTVFHVPPQYRASVTIYVNNYRSDTTKEYISGSSLTAAQQLVSTYTNIIQSDTVLDRVVKNGDLPYSTETIRGMMSAAQVGETELFKVYVTNSDPQVAADVVNAIARESLSGIEEFVEGSSARVVDYAKVPQTRYSPSYSEAVMTGAAVGGALALFYLTLRYFLNVQIKTAEDLEQIFEFPVLGQIPVFVRPESKTKNGYGYEADRTMKAKGKERDAK